MELEKIQAFIPGTRQIQIVPVVTSVMTITTWVVTEYTAIQAPEMVWSALTGLIIYVLQYWHGPRI